MTTNCVAGVMRTADLRAVGMSRRNIDAAVAVGTLQRLRRGWYAAPGADQRVVRAVKAGGCLGCASALAHHGAWDVTSGVIHTRTDHNLARVASGLRRCLPDIGHEHAPTTAVDDLWMALRCARRCLSDDDFIVVCDSLVNRRLMALADIRATIGPGHAAALDRCAWAESGTETLVRLRLRRRKVELRTQVTIADVGRVDLLVGERLVIEVDSKEHHTGEERYQADRRRDLELRALGYIVVRLTYRDVMFDWALVEPLLLVMLRRGDQWWASRKGRRPGAFAETGWG